jgi:hypothetical protein
MKRKNTYRKTLDNYRKELEKYIHEEEVRAALDIPLDRLNLNNVMQYGAYYHGARMALLLAMEYFNLTTKGDDKVYINAVFELATQSPRHTEMFLSRQPIRFRNHQYARKKLIKCEAYFYEEVTMHVQVEP